MDEQEKAITLYRLVKGFIERNRINGDTYGDVGVDKICCLMIEMLDIVGYYEESKDENE